MSSQYKNSHLQVPSKVLYRYFTVITLLIHKFPVNDLSFRGSLGKITLGFLFCMFPVHKRITCCSSTGLGFTSSPLSQEVVDLQILFTELSAPTGLEVTLFHTSCSFILG